MQKLARYNPDKPRAVGWSSLSEGEQIDLVEEAHRKERLDPSARRLHAATHVVVENQILLGDSTPVAEALERLQRGGLSRHDAVHAIGSVLAEHVLEIVQEVRPGDPSADYYEAIRNLTVESWYASFS